jgi:hypothetical protein
VNREERRAAIRAHRRDRAAHRPPKMCPPGQHAYQGWTAGGTLRRVVCTKCNRRIEEILAHSPADLELYRQWLADEKAAGRL